MARPAGALFPAAAGGFCELSPSATGRYVEVACFLSPEWFDELGTCELQVGSVAPAPTGSPDLVVGVVVAGPPQLPDGEVRYQVAVTGHRGVVRHGPDAGRRAQVVLHADYGTMAGIASGRLSAIDAMSSGQARITGNTAALSAHQAVLEALDLVPPSVRASTTF